MNKNIKKMIKGKRVIGEGSSRVVYDLGNGYVLKVAKSKHGIISNKKEVNIYKSAPSPVRKHLATIINYGNGYRWLVMRKYTRTFPQLNKYRQKILALILKFRRNGIVPHDLRVYKGGHYQNLRLKHNGKIVVIDYGGF
jgi:hypothetical protein